MPSAVRPSAAGYLVAALPPLLVFAGAVGYIGVDYWVDELPESVPGEISPYFHAGLVALQAAALLLRRRSPFAVFGAVVLLDLVVLATTAGELGIGALAVIFASYTMARRGSRRAALIALGAGALATTAVGGGALLLGSSEPFVVILITVVTRIGLLYAAPAAVAEYYRGRERLADALRDQARMVEQERRERAEREVRAERAALARELHDIAGHHLSGIIVSAQAASALARTDPEGARAMMQTVQDDARTTLADLRRTVGLLRSDDEVDRSGPGNPSPVPSLSGLPSLVDDARQRGQSVDYVAEGEPRQLGPLAETAAYRMVQESLANAARHARGASCHVGVIFAPSAVEITVSNEAVSYSAASPAPVALSARGYGLAGMAERAELIGASVSTGPRPSGGWLNRLTIPTDERSSS